jgi:hypothetical protein
MPNWKKIITSGSNAALATLSVSSGITGSLLGTASFATQALSSSFAATASLLLGSVVSSSYAATASIATSSSYALTASFALSGGGGGGLTTKSGNIINAQFIGNPKKATVDFAIPFIDDQYAVTITGEDSRTWTIEDKVSGSFVVNANSNTILLGTTYWICIIYGES